MFCDQAHPDFSPVGWHLGHIGYTEAKWILHHMAGLPDPFPQYHRLFAADGLPKHERQNLPNLGKIIDYLAIIRTSVLDYLQSADRAAIESVEQQRLWQFLLQHESQHSETIAIVLAIIGQAAGQPALNLSANGAIPSGTMLAVPAGKFWIGCDRPEGLDNERPAHWVEVADFAIDRHPVSCAEYRQFIAAGGYQDQRWWSPAGWAWLEQQTITQQAITQPYYWPPDQPDDRLPDDRLPDDRLPVCGVSWYEADAYAKFVGKRLPTETEWEAAANYAGGSPLTGIGQVWEWTNSWFAGYPDFEWFPYPGYSQTYFDRQHRVLRGGSWATRRWATRSSFRNWYEPGTRVIFAGIRCAQDRSTVGSDEASSQHN